MPRRLCAVLVLLVALGTVPAWASASSERTSPRAAFAALWDRVTAPLLDLWEGLVALGASTAGESSDPGAPPPADPIPQDDAGGILDPLG